MDHRADLFAVGCLLYELWTGRIAFEAEDEAKVIARVLSGERPPIRALRPETPGALEALIDGLLDADPGRRPPTCGDVRTALKRL